MIYSRNHQPWNARSNSYSNHPSHRQWQGENSRTPLGMQRVSPCNGDRVEIDNGWFKNVGLSKKPVTCS